MLISVGTSVDLGRNVGTTLLDEVLGFQLRDDRLGFVVERLFERGLDVRHAFCER